MFAICQSICQIDLAISEDCNVISVDWGLLVAPYYRVPIANPKKVGVETAILDSGKNVVPGTFGKTNQT